MRRLIAIVAATAIVAALAYVVIGHAPPPDVHATPSVATFPVSKTFTNSTGSTFDGVDIVSGGYETVSVTSNPPGCGTPSVTTVSLPPVVFAIPPSIISFSRLRTELRWPTQCIDPGESLTVVFDVNSALLSLPAPINGWAFPTPAATFFDASEPTATPTATATPNPSAPLTFTNTTGLQRGAVVVHGGYSSLSIDTSPDGCGVPVITYEIAVVGTWGIAMLPIVGRITTIDYPTPCIDPGESITVTLGNLFNYPGTLGAEFIAGGLPRIVIDCDLTTTGVQDLCAVPSGATSYSVDVLLIDNSAANSVAAFEFRIRNTDPSSIDAVSDPAAFTGNPDFNEAGPGVSGVWNCTISVPSPEDDTGDLAGDEEHRLACFVGSGIGPVYALGTVTKLAHIDYAVGAAGSSTLSFTGGVLGNNDGIPVLDCAGPDDTNETGDDRCFGATILVGVPSAPSSLPDLIVDDVTIDLENYGACNFTSTTLGLHVTVKNIGGAAAGSFVVDANGDTQTVAGLGAGQDIVLFFSGQSMSFNSVTVDSTTLVLESDESNNNFTGPVPIPTLPPTCTPTATATATVTPTPGGPAIGKVPEQCFVGAVNGGNADCDIPSANLFLCQVGPCAGPGEGNLIVHEYATNIDTAPAGPGGIGLGAYEFDIEYDNFIISSVNPSDIVFSPPSVVWPGGADGVLDGEGVARGPANCAFSIVTENVIHFGCVTLGLAPNGPEGDMDLARLNLIPHEDLDNDLFPGNDNGVITILKDNGCETVDVLGHATLGSINGGLTVECGDIAVTIRILEGDLNLDCVVDVTDQQLIAFRYGSFFGSLLYSQWYDLEPNLHDLDIDIKDLQKVFGRDGSTCQVPIPEQTPAPPPAPL